MSRPRLLDLFCGAGGCSVGYHEAGFDVVGVDLHPQPNYPFPFIQADAMDYLSELTSLGPASMQFDAIHASPPCQGYSIARNNGSGQDAPLLIAETRRLLKLAGLPYVIENVEGAAAHMDHPVRLCGASFGLRLAGMDLSRHRLFETNWPLLVPPCQHERGNTVGVYGHGTNAWHHEKLGRNIRAAEARAAMGIDWMTRDELTQAIPPAYTRFIGEELLRQLGRPSLTPVGRSETGAA